MSLENLKSRNDLSIDEINLLMDNENNTKMYKKLSYFRFKALGFTKKESYKLAGIKKSTAYNLEDQWLENGYNGLLPKGKGGRNLKLDKNQLTELKSILDTKDEWLVNDVVEIIKNKWNIDYSYVGTQNLLETQFNVNIGNYYSNKQENKKQTKNIIENFNDIDQENKDELNKIIGLMKNEKDLFVYRKLIYLLFKLLGFSTEVASSFLNITPVTGNSWTKQWNENKYEGLLKKSGQGRKPKLTNDELDSIKKKLSERDDWFTWEILCIIQEEYGVTYSYSYITRLLRTKFNAKFAKPYPKDYRQSPYYKSSFYLKLYHIFKKYNLKYDIETESIINLDTNEPFLIFSFDESAFQFTANNVHVWSLYKPKMDMDTTHLQCKVAGAYSLCKNGKDDLVFLENSTKESIVHCLESLRGKNPLGEIVLLIDNFKSHISTLVKEKAAELNIILCYLPFYSPQLQPEEKIWKDNKREIASYKINTISNYPKLKKKEKEKILSELVEKSFYEKVKSKTKWNKVLNNYIKPIIKKLNPKHNTEWEVQKIS